LRLWRLLLQLENAVELASNDYTSLRPGYWVVYLGKMLRADARDFAQLFQSWGCDHYAQEVSG
jgi:hypothetical protein